MSVLIHFFYISRVGQLIYVRKLVEPILTHAEIGVIKLSILLVVWDV